MFVDEFECTVRGGKGGDGCVSLRHEAYAPRGGPDGGDGGDGGSVILLPTIHENTLYHLVGRREFVAQNGEQGGSRDCYGKQGQDLIIKVPVGTVIYDAEHGNILRDLDRDDEPFVLAQGGRGGRGNARFATATNRTPRQYEKGRPGEERRVRLSVKLIADVGLVGLPNAGKSTLLAALSRARPKIANYPFTTLEPHLGIVALPGEGSFVMADIPGLIEGAHLGKGLGDKFLKHVERTRVLLHLVDCSSSADMEPEMAFQTIRREIESYSPELASRTHLVVATKVEDQLGRERAEALALALAQPVLSISAATREGLRPLLDTLAPMLAPATS